MRNRKIYFKGCGLTTTRGGNLRENLANAESPEAGAVRIDIKPKHKTVTTPYFPIAEPSIDEGPARIDRVVNDVVDEALDDAGLTDNEIQTMGLFLGSTSFDIHSAEHILKSADLDIDEIARRTPPFTGPTEQIVHKYNIRGPVFTVNTACTSSANALMYAADAVRGGQIDHALVVGMELFNEMTVLGFASLELMSDDRMRPFDARRYGLILGEACGAVVLTAEPPAHGFGYLGGANLADNFNVTASNPDGSTVARVVERALRDAGVEARDIRLIKAHGTASPSNDEAEARGLHRVFETVPPITALKPVIGHTLGACGIVELILFYQSLLGGNMPVFDGGLAIDEHYDLQPASAGDPVTNGCYLLNYFAFGGNNTALVVGSD